MAVQTDGDTQEPNNQFTPPATGDGDSNAGDQQNTGADEGDDNNNLFKPPGSEDNSDGGDKDGEDSNKDGDGEDGKGEGEQEIEYTDFTFPEGMDSPDKEIMSDYTDFAKENGFTQEQAQANIDYQIKLNAQNMQAQADHQTEAMQGAVKELVADKEYGGSKINQTYKDAQDYIQNHASPKLKELVLGSGNIHPQLIKEFAKTYQKLHKEGGANIRGGDASGKELTDAQVLFGTNGKGN